MSSYLSSINRAEQSKQSNNIFLSVDGDNNSKAAVKITFYDILPRIKNRKLLSYHVFNSKEDSEYNWQYKKEYIIEKYKEIFEKQCIYEKLFITEDKQKELNIYQTYEYAKKHKSRYFIVGYDSLKEQSLLPINREKSIDFLLSHKNQIPTILIKEDKMRRDKENKGFKWLIILDRMHINCFKAFDFFYPLIDKEKDFIYGATYVSFELMKDNIRDYFFRTMKRLGFVHNLQFLYKLEFYENSSYNDVKETVNNNPDYYFDFVVFYNDPELFKEKKKNYESYKMVNNLRANLCFVNTPFIDGFEPYEIVDEKEIERIKIEDEIKRLQALRLQRRRENEEFIYEAQLELLSDIEYNTKIENKDTLETVHDLRDDNNYHLNKNEIDSNDCEFLFSDNLINYELNKEKGLNNKIKGTNNKDMNNTTIKVNKENNNRKFYLNNNKDKFKLRNRNYLIESRNKYSKTINKNLTKK